LLQQGIRRKDKKINNLKSLLQNMRSKGLIEEQCEQLLINQFEGTSQEIFCNELKNKGKRPTGYRYSKQFKEFAATLHYYSPKALKYCRYYTFCYHKLFC